MASITIWVTHYFISQRICAALKMGLGDSATLALCPTRGQTATEDQIAATSIHIGYGILDGMETITRLADTQNKDWFILDLGYTQPKHFGGTYRIGFKGTQSLFDKNYLSNNAPELQPWKTGGETALICPPTDYVQAYYGIDDTAWCAEAEAKAHAFGLPAKFRRKGDGENLDTALASTACVITFNSSVAWKALQRGIPAISDVTRSTVGSWHGAESIKSLDALKACDRRLLFQFMTGNELTLLQIQQGLIRDILKRYSPTI